MSLGSACLDSNICLSIHHSGYFLKAVRKLSLQSQSRWNGRAIAGLVLPPQIPPWLTSPHHLGNAANHLPCPLVRPFWRMPHTTSPHCVENYLLCPQGSWGKRKGEERKGDSKTAISKRRRGSRGKTQKARKKKHQREMRNINIIWRLTFSLGRASTHILWPVPTFCRAEEGRQRILHLAQKSANWGLTMSHRWSES